MLAEHINGYCLPKSHSVGTKYIMTWLLTCLLNRITYFDKVKFKFCAIFLKKKKIFICHLRILSEHIMAIVS